MRVLNTRVHLDGEWYGPGPVPPEVAAKIPNPAVWDDTDALTEQVRVAFPVPGAGATIADLTTFAEENRIDLGEAQGREEIRAVVDGWVETQIGQSAGTFSGLIEDEEIELPGEDASLEDLTAFATTNSIDLAGIDPADAAAVRAAIEAWADANTEPA